MRKKFVIEDEETCTLQMGPMMDCTFLLLLYFVSVSTIDQVRISKDVRLPNTKQGIVEKDKSGQFIIDIEWHEAFYEPTYKIGPLVVQDPSDLTPLIQRSAEVGRSKNFRVILRADQRVPYEFTQQVMAAVAAADVPNLMFSTVEKEN